MKVMLVLVLISVILFQNITAQNSTEQEEDQDDVHDFQGRENVNTRRIVGGNFAMPDQFPFIASLRLKGSHFCGGAIIGVRWVLTAAHCFDRTVKYIDQAFVIIGSRSLNKRGLQRNIDGLIPHKSYDESTFTNDICLVRVYPNIIYSEQIKPIPLMKPPAALGSWVTIVGWGDTKYEGDLSSDLKYTYLQVFPNWQCKRMFQRYMSDTLACGLAGPGEGTCNGDSGGPLVQNGLLIGISVWGLYCAAGYPDTFTRVHLYLDWISQNTGHYDVLAQDF